MSKVEVFKISPEAIIPKRQSEEAAGYDLHALKPFTMALGDMVIVPTGLVVRPPEGYHTEIVLRSGMAAKYGIMLTNSVGIIDRDYAGPKDELKVMLSRPTGGLKGSDRVHFQAGDRIAQMIFRKTEILDLEEVSSAPKDGDRGGLGSTGH